MRIKHIFATVVLPLFLSACLGIPKGIKPVESFDIGSYSGQWYEIARMKNDFEKNLDHVTANYSLNDDGSIKVINQGINNKSGEMSNIEGSATFARTEDIGYLKVSFFKPFSASYVIFKLDPNYNYAYVTSYNKDYLWLLSRTPTVSKAVLDDFYATAKAKGFKVNNIIQVNQE
ncbi:lipocalin [Parashewanella curva]|uniref:Outer membrane lipoprotein Blc n=1 Tax=Parashewanella curva TaxID=2338552 RepID=A0A3L8Q039_9GAMM|nr:lipocalin family protein [Parashewanella curva]RLV60143.1 lipocalin [Parashewanella curva]